DYLSAARGYGLALGFLFWSLFLLTRYLAEDYDPPREALYRAGLGCGLAIASNLVFLVPVLAAGAVFSLLVLLSGRRSGFRSRFWEVVDRFWGPALVTTFLIVAIPLTRALPRHFYYGAHTLSEAVQHLAGISLTHKLSVWRLGHHLPRFDAWLPIAAHFVVPFLSALVALAAIALAYRWAHTGDFRALGTRERATLLVAGTMALSLTALVAANAFLGVLYPLGRTGIYWLPLFPLGVALASAWMWNSGPVGKAAASLAGVFAIIAAGLFIAGFAWDQYPDWRYDAGTRRIAGMVRTLPRPASTARLRLCSTWVLEPSLNFYRHKDHLDWIEPVARDGLTRECDIYVLLREDEHLIAQRHLRSLYRDPVSDQTLAVPSPSAGAGGLEP
ncbi:MAG TPA: hypothetical protein VHA11_02240, partial [Bryobacteraceae bacterium]|nr:hypothetical protein [Bryobacteraceae bacterium]